MPASDLGVGQISLAANVSGRLPLLAIEVQFFGVHRFCFTSFLIERDVE
jgi:hypothetical protein